MPAERMVVIRRTSGLVDCIPETEARLLVKQGMAVIIHATMTAGEERELR